MLNISRFSRRTDNHASLESLGWADLSSLLHVHDIRAEKDGPLWSPATFIDGLRRKDRVEEVCALVFDLDGVSAAQVEALTGSLRFAGHTFVAHTTHSHTNEEGCWRLVVPLARPVTPAELERVRASFISRYPAPYDTQAFDASRIFYLPSSPPGRAGEVLSASGAALDPSGFLAPLARAAPAAPAATPQSTDEIVAALKKVRDPKHVDWVQNVLKREALAPVGRQDNTLQLAAGFLVFKFPEASDATLLHLLKPSLSLMDWAEGFEHLTGVMEDKLARARRRKEEEDTRNATFALAAIKEQRLAASNGAHDGAYTPEELERMQRLIRADGPQGMKRAWIVQYRNSFHILGPDGYDFPLPKEAAQNHFKVALSRATEHVEFAKQRGETVYPKSLDEMVTDHGTVAHHCEFHYGLESSYFDPRTKTLRCTAAPVRDIKPQYHSDIQRWLELLGGPDVERFLDWVATFTDLSSPTAALYLDGPRNAGKSLLAYGLARFWGAGKPVEVKGQFFNSWNDDMLHNPVLFVDEALAGGDSVSQLDAQMRRVIMATYRPVSIRYLPNVSLTGANRVILAANDDDMLSFSTSMTREALDATAERYFYLKIGSGVAPYLNSLGGRAGIDWWVSKDGIAQHAAWLRDTRQVRRAHRLCVEGKLDALRSKLALSAGAAPAVAQCIVRCLLDHGGYAKHVSRGEGEVLVNLEELLRKELWEDLVPGYRTPNSKQITKALQGMVKGQQVRMKGSGIRATTKRYWRLDVEILAKWAEDNGLADASEVKERAAVPNADIRAALAAAPV